MSDNLNFLCGTRARSTVGRAEREVARLRRKVGCGVMSSGLSPAAAGDWGSAVASSVLQCDFLQQHHNLHVSAGRGDTLINLGF